MDVKIFQHEQFGKIRGVMIDGEPWLVGKDVAAALGYTNPRKALIDHVDEEDKNTVTIRDGIPGNPNMTIINESGLYSLILSSKLPTAKTFKRWVTSEVLPSIRKTGQYSLIAVAPEEPEAVRETRIITKDDYIKAASIVANCRNERLPYVLSFLEQAGIRANVAPEGSRSTEPDESVIELIADFVMANKAQFYPESTESCYGYFDDGEETVYILPSVLYQILKKAHYSPRKTLRYLAGQGLIIVYHDSNGKKLYTVTKYYRGQSVRFIGFHIGGAGAKGESVSDWTDDEPEAETWPEED